MEPIIDPPRRTIAGQPCPHPWSRRVHRSPATAIHRRRAVRPRRPAHRPRRGHRGGRPPPPGRLLPRPPRHDLRRDPGPVRAARADRHRHRLRGPGARGRPRAGRWGRLPDQPHQPDAHGRQRRLLRPHRRAQGGPAEPDRGRRAHRRHRLRGWPRRGGGHRPRRAGAVRGQPEAGRDGLQSAAHAAPLRVRPPGLPPRAQGRDQRRAHRLPRPGHPDHGPPEVGPRDRRLTAVRGQDEPGAQSRRVRLGHRRQDGRRLQPGDEQGAAGAPSPRRRSPTSTRSACGRASWKRWTSPGWPRP